jgi:hypothetical protein
VHHARNTHNNSGIASGRAQSAHTSRGGGASNGDYMIRTSSRNNNNSSCHTTPLRGGRALSLSNRLATAAQHHSPSPLHTSTSLHDGSTALLSTEHQNGVITSRIGPPNHQDPSASVSSSMMVFDADTSTTETPPRPSFPSPVKSIIQ